jgi:hypothetical protein
MASKTNVVMIVLVIVALMAAGTVIGWRWLQRAATGMVQESRQEYDAGTTLGQSVTENMCVDTAFAQHARTTNRSMARQISENIFLESCLRASTPSGMCDTIPTTDSFKALMKFSMWSVEQCRLRGLSDRGCPRLLQVVSSECGRRTRPKGS